MMKKMLIMLCVIFLTGRASSQTCTNESSLLNKSFAFTATQSGGNGRQSFVMDNDLQEANYWESNASGQSVTVDYKNNHVMNGFVYYPSSTGNKVLGYTMQSSTDNVNFTTVSAGSFPDYSNTSTPGKGIPTVIRFDNPITARYLRIIVADNGKRIAEIIPLICDATPINIVCSTGSLTSTGTDNTGTRKKVVRKFDNNWMVTQFDGGTGSPTTNVYNYSSIQNARFYPAIVVGKAVDVWASSPYNNAEWISGTQNAGDIRTPSTYFYKFKFNISDPFLVASLKLRLDYYTDNQIVRVYVNSVDQNINGSDAFSYLDGHQKSSLLDKDFQLGTNEIVIQVYSDGGYHGVLIQGIPSCYCYKDANPSPGIDANHGITLLNRAGADNGNWPMIRKSAYTVLESNTKGMVITRMATADFVKITNPVEGMMVFDTTAKCLKIYDGTAWKCFITPSCPDNN